MSTSTPITTNAFTPNAVDQGATTREHPLNSHPQQQAAHKPILEAPLGQSLGENWGVVINGDNTGTINVSPPVREAHPIEPTFVILLLLVCVGVVWPFWGKARRTPTTRKLHEPRWLDQPTSVMSRGAQLAGIFPSNPGRCFHLNCPKTRPLGEGKCVGTSPCVDGLDTPVPQAVGSPLSQGGEALYPRTSDRPLMSWRFRGVLHPKHTRNTSTIRFRSARIQLTNSAVWSTIPWTTLLRRSLRSLNFKLGFLANLSWA